MASEPEPLTPDELEAVYRTEIRPVLFKAAAGGEEKPTLVLLGGQPGAGKSRATARILAEHPGMAAVTGDDLRIFHSGYRTLVAEHPEQVGAALAESTRVWVRAALTDALEQHRSLLLEGTFGDPDVTLATAARFRDAGFQVRIVAIASPRVLSVVSAASRYLRDRQAGNPARFTRLSAHDRGYHGTTRLIGNLGEAAPADRVTIISRNGNTLFDRQDAFADAVTSLEEGRHPQSWGMHSTVELLGELKQITRYAIASGQLTHDTAELLIEAHDLALTEVVPNLSIDPDSAQARLLQQSVTEQLVALRRAAAPVELDSDQGLLPETASAGLELG
ncbi:zeta toxin family protein [Leifsonia sp. TF02-11]|uniref:zeta toxin family protein n=1 Tax=Leifsonia sp. TF02-11 TaxID=2815212 RepID=UPI001AA0D04A|nr:zeta toxin family protein [Leifsonia sp. TF02-11]MBO1740735.1 zeta toxin family protein [Leifsonia sp. TF02-11]